jgi:hypothetical protein
VVDDYALPTSFHSVLVISIHDQLFDFRAHFPEEGVLSRIAGFSNEHDDGARCMGRVDESVKRGGSHGELE